MVVPWSVPSSILKSSLFLVKCDDHSTRNTPTGEQEGLAVSEPTGGKRKVRKDVVNSVGKNRGQARAGSHFYNGTNYIDSILSSRTFFLRSPRKMSDMNQETERDKRRRRREGGKNKDLAERRRPLPCPESLPARATPPPTILILSSSEDDDEVQFAERGLGGGFGGGGTASDEDRSPERPLPVSPQVNEQKSLRKGAKGPKREASRKVLFVLQSSFKYFSSLNFQAKKKKSRLPKSHAPEAAPAVICDVDNVASNDELLEYFDGYVRRGNKVKPRCARQYASSLR